VIFKKLLPLWDFESMKAFYLLIVAVLISLTAYPQTEASVQNFNQPYYVVIGAFSVQKNAVRFTRQASRILEYATYEWNQNRSLFYVYSLETQSRDKALATALALRSRPDSLYSDAWIYHGSFRKPLSGEQPVVDEIIHPEKEVKLSIDEDKTLDPNASLPSSNQAQAKENRKPFIFEISRTDDSKRVKGEVVVADVDLAKRIGTYWGDTLVYVPQPKSKSTDIALSCLVFGYRKVQHNINYLNPQRDSIKVLADSTLVVPFKLMRLQKGDVAVMYDVFFFKDAAIMRPESRYEVGALVEMMKENAKYKIKIHGHTNGKSHGKVISMDGSSNNFFSLNNTKEGYGSAKKLSKARAELLKTYLISNGIPEQQLVVKAWGGKKPIFDIHAPQAQANVRVEIEILEN
jgi:outer membrane protein OmpA-like peptidoglycan-associated protein